MSKDKIEVNMNVYDIPIVVEQLEKENKEIERLKRRLEEYQEYVEINHKEIERLNNIINELEDRLQRIRNNECEKLAMKVARLGIPSSQLLDKSQKLKGEDEKVKMLKKYIPLFVVKSKVTGHEYNVYETKTKKSGMKFYKIYNYFTDKFEWLFYDIFEEVGEKE